MNINVEGRKALVSGSTQGIGKEIAIALAASGAEVILLARNKSQVEKVVEGLPGNGHRYLISDFTKFDELLKLQDEIKGSSIDILINNGGGPPPGLVHEAGWEEFETAINMHLKTSHHLLQWVLPNMKEKGFGRMINIISTSVKIPIHGLGVSNTVRGAIGSWVKTVSNEVGQFGITANSILPGFVETVRLEAIIENQMLKTNKSREQVIASMKSTVPVRRFGKPQEVASLAVFLCSEYAGYLNGLAIPIDGGRTGTI